MNIEWGSVAARKFVTNVGLVTTDGPYGPNVMACEWTHMISYEPGLIAVCVGKEAATLENIRKTRQFGISLASSDQKTLSSVSGSSSAKDTDKISALKELGFKFYKAKKIKAPMVQGSSLSIECRLHKEIPLGYHTMFIGEALHVAIGSQKPLVLHSGSYWELDTALPKPSDSEREKIRNVVSSHKKSQKA